MVYIALHPFILILIGIVIDSFHILRSFTRLDVLSVLKVAYFIPLSATFFVDFVS